MPALLSGPQQDTRAEQSSGQRQKRYPMTEGGRRSAAPMGVASECRFRVSLQSVASGCHFRASLQPGPDPAQSIGRGLRYSATAGAVFAADPAVVALLVEHLEQVVVVDLAHVRFM